MFISNIFCANYASIGTELYSNCTIQIYIEKSIRKNVGLCLEASCHLLFSGTLNSQNSFAYTSCVCKVLGQVRKTNKLMCDQNKFYIVVNRKTAVTKM